MNEAISDEKRSLRKKNRKRKSFRLTPSKVRCNICSKYFNAIGTLNRHMLIHSDHKELSCEICSKKFHRKDTMVQHLATHFQGHGLSKRDLTSMPVNALSLQYKPIIKSKDHTCGTCSKVCNSKNHLRSHMITHSNLKPFCCGICPKAFKRRSNLRNHFAVYHREYHQDYMDYMYIEEMNVGDVVKGFQCDVCSKYFGSKHSVRDHLYTHFDLKPYECKICSKGFRNQSQLRKHLRTHGNEMKHNNEMNTVCKQEVDIDENGFCETEDIKPLLFALN